MPLVHIGVGANLGDPPAQVEAAIAALTGIGRLVARSSLYRSAPWGESDQPDFINAVATIETEVPPRSLLAQLKTIEARLGRLPGERWGPRAIDLDILLYGDLPYDDGELVIPHPHLHRRAFVLAPLAEIDARFQRAYEVLDSSERAGVVKLTSEPE